jgi:hypothetical protein
LEKPDISILELHFCIRIRDFMLNRIGVKSTLSSGGYSKLSN